MESAAPAEGRLFTRGGVALDMGLHRPRFIVVEFGPCSPVAMALRGATAQWST